ncbi:MAG: tRNA pseudouridine(55) synthase TruB [Reyranellaceae bacterium]
MKRKGERVDGWLVLDKPAGISSARAVAIARRAFNAAKLGHGGTLDPLASGVLPLAFGEATKTVSLVMDGRKSYRFTLRFGQQTSTDDAEGEIVATSGLRPDDAAIAAVLPRFTGTVEQTPPAFSALKIDGKRAYALARQGQAPELKPRAVEIFRLELAARPDPDRADFEVDCGKGTYIRSLARDLALALGSVGHVAALRRTQVGKFGEKQAISLAKLEALGHSPARFEHLLPVETVLDDIPALAVTEEEAARLRMGQPLPALRTGLRDRVPPMPDSAAPLRAMSGDRLVALVRSEGGEIRPVRVINP